MIPDTYIIFGKLHWRCAKNCGHVVSLLVELVDGVKTQRQPARGEPPVPQVTN